MPVFQSKVFIHFFLSFKENKMKSLWVELMGIVDGNASHLHLEARLCRIWNCYDMFDKLKSKVTQLHLTQLHMKARLCRT